MFDAWLDIVLLYKGPCQIYDVGSLTWARIAIVWRNCEWPWVSSRIHLISSVFNFLAADLQEGENHLSEWFGLPPQRHKLWAPKSPIWDVWGCTIGHHEAMKLENIESNYDRDLISLIVEANYDVGNLCCFILAELHPKLWSVKLDQQASSRI